MEGVGQMEDVGQMEGVGVCQTVALNQSPLPPPGVVCVVCIYSVKADIET